MSPQQPAHQKQISRETERAVRRQALRKGFLLRKLQTAAWTHGQYYLADDREVLVYPITLGRHPRGATLGEVSEFLQND